MGSITDRIKELLAELPPEVILVAATKTRSLNEIEEAIDAGIKVIGENYVQEAESKFSAIGRTVRWHMVGHLQRNKVEKALEIFDCIQTLDNLRLAKEINKIAGEKRIQYPVLIEINSAHEEQKSGILPENTEELLYNISQMPNIKVEGLMTMGPLVRNPEEIRPYFRRTKEIFERLKDLQLQNIEMKHLSMGMSDTWRIAVEEGANMVRIGTAIFGAREMRRDG